MLSDNGVDDQIEALRRRGQGVAKDDGEDEEGSIGLLVDRRAQPIDCAHSDSIACPGRPALKA